MKKTKKRLGEATTKNVTESRASGAVAAEPDYAPMELTRTREYAKRFLDRPLQEVIDDIGHQVASILLLMNETMLRLLERLNDPRSNEAERASIQAHIQALIGHTGNVARNKTSLLNAIGAKPEDFQFDADGNVVGLSTPQKRITADQFESLLGGSLNPFAVQIESAKPNDSNNQPGTPAAEQLVSKD